MKKSVLAVLLLFTGMASAVIQQNPPVGLINIGNSCFMNAALQCLYNLKSVTDVLTTTPLYGAGTIGQLYTNFIQQIQTGTANPAPVCLAGWKMMGYPQATAQDADEFLTQLLDHLTDRDLIAATKNANKQKLAPFLGTAVSSTLFYAPDNYVSKKKIEEQPILILPIAGTTLAQCLQNFMQGEDISGFKLPSGKNVTVRKKLALEETKKYFIVTLKRTDILKDASGMPVFDPATGNLVMTRHDNPLSFPLKGLNLAPYYSNPASNNGTYDLTGIVMHSGTTAGGHYTAYVKSGNMWYLTNDTSITPVSEPEMASIAQRGYGVDSSTVPTTLFYEVAPVATPAPRVTPHPVVGPKTPAPKKSIPAKPVVKVAPKKSIPSKTVKAVTKPGKTMKVAHKKILAKPVKKVAAKPVKTVVKAAVKKITKPVMVKKTQKPAIKPAAKKTAQTAVKKKAAAKALLLKKAVQKSVTSRT